MTDVLNRPQDTEPPVQPASPANSRAGSASVNDRLGEEQEVNTQVVDGDDGSLGGAEGMPAVFAAGLPQGNVPLTSSDHSTCRIIVDGVEEGEEEEYDEDLSEEEYALLSEQGGGNHSVVTLLCSPNHKVVIKSGVVWMSLADGYINITT